MQTTRDTLRFYWRHATKYPLRAYGLLVATPLTTLVHQFIPPLIVAGILERLSSGDFEKGQLWSSFGPELILYGICIIVGTIFAWRGIVMLIWSLEGKVVQDINQEVFSHLLKQGAQFHADNFGGSLVSQATKLSGSYVRFADITVFQVIPHFCALLFTVFILAPRAPGFVIALMSFAVIYMIATVFITKKVRKLNAEEATLQSKQTGFLADAITNVMAIKSFAGSAFENKKFAGATEKTRSKMMQVMYAATKQDFFFSSVTAMIMIMSLTMATAGVVLFDANIATAFLIVTYTARVGQGLWEFSGSIMRGYNRSFGDAKDMVEILKIDPEIQDPEKPEKSRIAEGSIAFTDVTFTHNENDSALFKALDITIKPGEKVGLVGHSGSGKTTLTRLLLRFSDIDSGVISIDGQDISKITQDDLRSAIAYVPQEPLLFHRSIKENIAYGKPGATDEEIFAAARKANAAEFIETLSDGYKTMVGERGVKLSGGQRQRIVIARAILKDAPILVLDEATSALDSESEKLIQDALQELMKKRTAIVIAHRLSTIQKMDRIFVMDHGDIIEQGSHAELLKRKGVYAGLWAHQSGGFIEE